MSKKYPEASPWSASEVADLCDGYELKIHQQQQEIERLREELVNAHLDIVGRNKDAERYRFIRHYQVSVLDVDGDGDCVWIVNAEEFDELDTAIDAAIDAAREE